ncbi:hypothetical protein QA641_18270 [Bradyrhizobium sp. CB1650]|uniref:hypothetical protein n=1 Tax=Bradyrhizobium sp. CB1650 TaxID=3039153 RepID=UPI002435FD5F|nr:hypothetical protein [Bradyrhizobium sp. CB1650]WGD55068.1 hypothetical protein QA641_14895 [Bradyrhizobium sp. CB1650]WGD55650.1 hypothetical protein QA641_18270 [Bradyrhizobium sp. CB1650]
MREKRRLAAPAASARTTKASIEPLRTGYALIVDGHVKATFAAKASALEAGTQLKNRFPRLQVKIYDAENKLSEAVEIARA